jgi:DNA mismatch repair ATPase MutS
MPVGDGILAGRSRYLAEAERLLALVRMGDSGEPTLCLIDELLSGTNAVERLAASRAILDVLADRGLLVVAATHDLELTQSLDDRYESYFFADDFSRDDLRFDYRLRPRAVTTRNATRRLERLGYPKEIIARAQGDRQ